MRLEMKTTCAVVGGGPAGMILGLLLARAGIDVTVLEKHADFFRDFRGDTVHPSTLDIMAELGLLDDFLRLPHQEQSSLEMRLEGKRAPGPDFTRLRTRCKFVALMPQWDFLNFLADRAKRYSGFHLMMETEGLDVLREGGRICGIAARGPSGALELRADLVVAADGRHSTMRERVGLMPENFGSPIDVLWMRLSRRESDGKQVFGNFGRGKAMVMLNRGDYWQCAYVIPKGGFDNLKARGLESFRNDIVAAVPYLHDRVAELESWDQVKLLTVVVNRLPHWWTPGLLCIGDAAHAMSPVGGVGINLAIGDAVAAANVLWKPLRDRRVSDMDLAAVQRGREPSIRKTQRFQVTAQDRVMLPVLRGKRAWLLGLLRLLLRLVPPIRGQMARMVGLGFRPEHVESPEID